jgi:catalase
MKSTFFSRTACVTVGILCAAAYHSTAQNIGQSSTPGQLVDALHAAFGEHHARAVHAKGIILKGTFKPDPQAATLSKAFHLQNESSTVTVRFSDFTAQANLTGNYRNKILSR